MTQLIKNGQQINENEFRSLFPETSFPAQIDYLEYGWSVVFPSPQPAYDPLTQSVRAIDPALTSKGHYEEQWEIVALPEEAVASNRQIEAERIAAIEATRISTLWQSAHEYEYAAVSGSAIGLLVMGVMQQKPKCMAVQSWIKSIWTEYYTRKATGSTDANFDVLGPCPHTVPDLMAELGL